MRRLAVVVVGLVLGIGAAALAIARVGGGDGVAQTPTATVSPSSASSEARTPAEANRRVLTAAQTRRLVRYATALHACLTARGVDVATPRKGPRAITIEAAKPVGLWRLVAEMTPCTGPLGDPPKYASLQAVDAQTIVLSVPKRCLLDPKTELPAPPEP